MRPVKIIFLLFVFSMLYAASAGAADHNNLEEGLPVQVEDAYTIPYMGRELQGYARFEDGGEGEDRFIVEPRFEYGVLPNTQVRLSVPVLAGSGDKAGSGNIRLEGLYNFNAESAYIPAFAASLLLDFPSGRHSAGTDTTLKIIASKMPFRSPLLNRVHINASWTHNSGAFRGERDDLYKVILGYSIRFGKDTVMVLDLLRQTEREKGKESNIFEGGFRIQITPLVVFSVGAGAGLGDDSPDLLISLGLQKSF